MDGVCSLDVTQLTSSTEPGVAAKRRRIETGWAALRDAIIVNGNKLQAVTW
jgi:hypothetical protein